MSIEAPPGLVDEVVNRAVETHRASRGALLPILHAVSEELGHVPPSVVPVLADRLNLSTAEVHGVVTFYRDFRTTPPGRVTVRVCRAEACQAVGAEALLEHAVASLGVERGETTPDGAVTLDEVFCLGNCALGPAVQVGDRLHGRVTPARLDALIGQAR
ncbi:formate dehydrogenase subunit gamma [Pseudonocardia sp. N23]|uniref:formate dehydrogenase subunit gamma n=1 Tax=Pseudonocardia sp. N23 TaxID=1987376 RepID=UPI000BFD152B|nr:formate dehydrogenase subunit gamma [Pseudonocardia sp. N23]GAY10429.1 NAD-dependent formate dehydrogenase gamma subunit [Pseudonocardia sp. N23]